MPIHLPPQAVPWIALPPPPQDPPTLNDVVAARDYQRRVEQGIRLQREEGPDDDDTATAEIYKMQVLLAHSAVDAAPAWFVPAMREMTAPIMTIAARAHNMQLHDGRFVNFIILPFQDGTMPNEAPHNLPPLTTPAAIQGLTAAQAAAYANGYGLGVPVVDRRVIARHIGCTVWP